MAVAFAGGEIDAEIGQLKFVMKSWGSSTDALKFEELAHRPCTREDFTTRKNVDEWTDFDYEPSPYGFYAMDDAS